MFSAQPFLNLKMMSEIVSEFQWPEPFSLEDEMPDGILLSFTNSNFFFTETPDGDIVVKFLHEDTRTDENLHLGHALMIFVPLESRVNGVATNGLINIVEPFPSEQKSANGIWNACMIILTHMRGVIAGDYSWVRRYLEQQSERRLG